MTEWRIEPKIGPCLCYALSVSDYDGPDIERLAAVLADQRLRESFAELVPAIPAIEATLRHAQEGIVTDSDLPFKGDFDLGALASVIADVGADRIPFVRVEAGTNLIGGQPVSLANMRDVSRICREHGIPCMLDASLLQDNLYFMKMREPQCAD